MAERRFTTMCASADVGSEDSVVAIREGKRSANKTRGCGSIAIDVNEESVAPWNSLVCAIIFVFVFTLPYEVLGIKEVTTATGCAIFLNNFRRPSFKLCSSCSGRVPWTFLLYRERVLWTARCVDGATFRRLENVLGKDMEVVHQVRCLKISRARLTPVFLGSQSLFSMIVMIRLR